MGSNPVAKRTAPLTIKQPAAARKPPATEIGTNLIKFPSLK